MRLIWRLIFLVVAIYIAIETVLEFRRRAARERTQS